ncbi:MAG: hypothetical protein K8T20_15485 [Planctomycetes bacterium]|nr:hypothetical protein [Planctomycetota bacterium]
MAAASKVPDWAPSYDEPLYQRFIGAVLREAEKRWGKANETLDGVKAGGRIRELRELAETCRHMREENWPRAIEGCFSRMDVLDAGAEEFRKRADLKESRDRLRIRIVPEKQNKGDALGASVTRPVAPGMVAALVLDEKLGGDPVTPEMADEWGVSTTALFEVARANHKRRKVKKESGQGFVVNVLMGEDPDIATEVLFLDHYVKVEPPAGTIVVVPTQRSLLFHEVHDKKAVEALQTVLVVGHQLYQQGPFPVLPLLYWWRRRRFALLPIEVQGETVRFMPPVEFVQALQKIGVDLTA